MLSVPETAGDDKVPPPVNVTSLAVKPIGGFEKVKVMRAVSPIFKLLLLEVMTKLGAAPVDPISTTSRCPGV